MGKGTGSYFSILILITWFVCCVAQLPTDGNFQDVLIVGGLNKPTDYVFVPDGRIFFSSKTGIIQVFKNGALLSTPLVNITSEVQNGGDKVSDPDQTRGTNLLIGLTFHCYPSTFCNKSLYLSVIRCQTAIS
jgi:hypothetical protein